MWRLGRAVRVPCISICGDGPHFLVAGTTGSGKSEFLRTLAAGLAASHPPDRVNLLFIDFKGGSGLGPLTGLPHCVGMLTDLGAAEVDRTLVSLRAEVRRREELLARAGVPDLAGYEASPAPGPAVPYLVIVIDEFSILVDEAPAALAELMRIAAIGRSLGIHLIMATQRPQGAVNADIRANVTTCIALRVQTVPESMDIMGSGLAAAIPIARPGRAFLVRGRQAPEEFQTATLSLPGPPRGPTRAVTVRTVADELTRPPAAAGFRADGSAGREADDGAALAPLPAPALTPALAPAHGAAALDRRRCGRVAGSRQHERPAGRWQIRCPPCCRTQVPGTPGGTWSGWGGWTCRNSNASRSWAGVPPGMGIWALSALKPAPGTQSWPSQLISFWPAAVESHLYILDAAGAFSAAAAASRVGAVAGLHEVRRAARVLRRVAEEATSRLGVRLRAGRGPGWFWCSAAGAPGFRHSGPGRWPGQKTSSMTSCGTVPGQGSLSSSPAGVSS